MNNTVLILSVLFALDCLAAPDSVKRYGDTCAAKLFNEPHYNEVLNAGSPLVDQIVGEYRNDGWPPPALFSVPDEYRRARPFLLFLTNKYPASVAGFIPSDCNTNVAQAVWATVLENYRDGRMRMVVPDDVRTLLFMCKVVLPKGIEGTNNLRKFQYVDSKMVHTGSKLVLESIRNWTGDLARVENPNADFSRVAHREFWNMVVTYVGIMKHFEPDYASRYLEDIVLCRQENICRWLWDAAYLEGIKTRYAPDLAGQFWFEPRNYIPVLIEWEFPEKIPHLLDLTGKAVLELTDRLIAGGLPADDERARGLIKEVCARIRGAASAGGPEGRVADRKLPGVDLLSLSAIRSPEAFEAAALKWIHLFRLHWQLHEKQPVPKENPWINILAWKKLPLLEKQLAASDPTIEEVSDRSD
ncbi:MAG TPA: hypothetical protein PKE12_13935 [Kiritimatiellia bacterium]|nr:hypothetical protein [Kiritimatiellia bacterium]